MKNVCLLKIKKLLLIISASCLTGIFSALIITFFKLAAEKTIMFSSVAYSHLRQKPQIFPLFILLTAIIGYISSLIITKFKGCRGGGIPTSIAAIKGTLAIKWLSSITVLPVSALLTFLVGVPLGTEGPCVQMGTAIGKGTHKFFGGSMPENSKGHVMSGGAAAGFSIATASPLSAVIFSFEELNHRFSPALLLCTGTSILSASGTVKLLSMLGISSNKLFDITKIDSLPLKKLFLPLIFGIIIGLFAILFSRLYSLINQFVHKVLSKISVKIIIPLLFIISSAIGFILPEFLGTGHHLTETLLVSRKLWYVLLLILLTRCLILLFSNSAGVTGGIFLPTIVFGAILGALFAEGAIMFGLITENYYTLFVVLGIVSFLAATSHIPLTACVFSIEALAGINNIPSIIISIIISYLIIRLLKLEDLTDTVIKTK